MKIPGLLLALLCAGSAMAQGPACRNASDVKAADMLGLWHAELEGAGRVGTLLLEKHPLYAESFRGAINRNGERRAVAGDVEDGDFTLEESADGVRIAAAWVGELVQGSCGREVRGTWTIDGEKSGRPFVLRKQ